MDKDAIIAEILAATSEPLRQPSDVDKSDLAPQLGVNVTTVPSRMQPLVDSGAFETMMVYDRTRKRSVRIWRKL